MIPPLRDDNTIALPVSGKRLVRPIERSGVRYHLLEEIARGGMGVVFRAHDPELDRMLALKVLREDHLLNPEMHRRFLEEARIASGLQHPGIVPIHDIGRLADDRPFFTMKFVEGRTFAEILARRTSPQDDLQRHLGIFEQVCQTMAYAHSRGVVHRDLKPSNIMVGSFGEVQVMDWGLAKILDEEKPPADVSSLPRHHPLSGPPDLTEPGSVVGTPAYMAPEQARGNAPIDEHTDVFGLGGILCEILTGCPPYTLPRSASTWLLDQDRDLAEAHARLLACPADHELITLARHCLADQPADRPRDASVVARRITEYRAEVQDRLRQAEIDRAAAEAGQARALAQRKAARLQGLLGVCLFVLIALGLVVGWYGRERQRSTEERVARLSAQADRLAEEAEKGQGSERSLEAWREAVSILDQAGEALRPGWAAPSLARTIQERRARFGRELALLGKDRHFVEQLVQIRLEKDDDLQEIDTNRRYEEAFREAELDLEEQPLHQIAQRLRNRPAEVRREVVIALDDWFQERRLRQLPETQWRPLLQLATELDGNAWRNDLRRSLIAPRSSRTPIDLVAEDFRQELTVPGGLSRKLLSSGLETLRRRIHLQSLARSANLEQLPPASLQLLARVLKQEGELLEAVRILREAQRRNPTDVWLNHDLANALTQLPRPEMEEAVRFYTAARAVRSDVGHALAHALFDIGKTDEAIRTLQELTRIKPENFKHHLCLGLMLARQSDFEGAERELLAVVKDSPNLQSARYHLGNLYYSQGRYSQAAPHLQRAAELDPRDVRAAIQYAISLERTEPFLIARRAYEEGMVRFPNNAILPYNLGHLYGERKETAEAIRYYRRAIALDPTYAEALCNLGLLLRDQGKFQEGLEALRKGEAAGKKRSSWPYPSNRWIQDCEQLLAAASQLDVLLESEALENPHLVKIAMRVCLYKERYADAVYLATRMQAYWPMQTTGIERAALAEAALRAAEGEGVDRAVNTSEQMAYRLRALTWLTTELRALERRSKSRNPLVVKQVVDTLQEWLDRPSFAPIRDPEGLSDLPYEERDVWEAFWARVRARA